MKMHYDFYLQCFEKILDFSILSNRKSSRHFSISINIPPNFSQIMNGRNLLNFLSSFRINFFKNWTIFFVVGVIDTDDRGGATSRKCWYFHNEALPVQWWKFRIQRPCWRIFFVCIVNLTVRFWIFIDEMAIKRYQRVWNTWLMILTYHKVRDQGSNQVSKKNTWAWKFQAVKSGINYFRNLCVDIFPDFFLSFFITISFTICNFWWL